MDEPIFIACLCFFAVSHGLLLYAWSGPPGLTTKTTFFMIVLLDSTCFVVLIQFYFISYDFMASFHSIGMHYSWRYCKKFVYLPFCLRFSEQYLCFAMIFMIEFLKTLFTTHANALAQCNKYRMQSQANNH